MTWFCYRKGFGRRYSDTYVRFGSKRKWKKNPAWSELLEEEKKGNLEG